MGDTLNGDGAFFAEDRVSMVLTTRPGLALPVVERLSARFGRKVGPVRRVGVDVSRDSTCRASILDAGWTVRATTEESDP